MTDARKLYSNITFEINPKEDEYQYLERQELAFKYFYHLNKSSKILNDSKALSAINYTHSNLVKSFRNVEKQIKISMKYDFTKIILNIIENCYQRIIECIHFITEVNEINDKNRIGSMAICLMSVEILDRFSYYSKEFSIKFHLDNQNSFKSILNFINNRKIQDNCSMLFRTQPKSQEFILMKGIFKSLFSSLVNLTKHSNNECKRIWYEYKSIEIFQNYLLKMNNAFNIKIYIYLILAYLMSENITDEIAKYLAGIFSLIVNNQSRTYFKIDPVEKAHQIAYISKSGHLFNSIDLIQALYKLASVDKLKQHIYYKYKLKKYLIRSIYNSSEFELRYSLDLLWLLIYDADIAKDLTQDELLMKFIKSLSKSSSYNKVIQNISYGILWQLSYRFKSSISNNDIENNNINISKITIINQSDNMELCLLIRNELDNYDCRTFIDLNNMFDLKSSLQNIKNSFCILICLNEMSELNTGFRGLIEYAFKLNKPIIPIIMQKKKLNGLDSWLGWTLFIFYSFTLLFIHILLFIDEFIKTKICFHFYKSSFHLCFNGLIDHIEVLRSNQKMTTTSIPNSSVVDWNEESVVQWLKSKNINQIIFDHITPCNGSVLFELYLISIDAPNYFYQHISKFKDDVELRVNDENEINTNSNEKILITMGDFTLFKKYLKELFE
jgi:hypothetical protein